MGDELERAWVNGMNDGEAWHARYRDKIIVAMKREKQDLTMMEIEKPRWKYPIEGLDWVRSWMLWRREFFVLHDEGVYTHLCGRLNKMVWYLILEVFFFFPVAIIAQGISARAALGQASSASASSSNEGFDLFGKLAMEASGQSIEEEKAKAKL